MEIYRWFGAKGEFEKVVRGPSEDVRLAVQVCKSGTQEGVREMSLADINLLVLVRPVNRLLYIFLSLVWTSNGTSMTSLC